MATKPPITEKKISSLIDLYKGGKTVKEIVNITGVKQRTVYRWLKRFRDGGEASSPVHKTRPGRGRKVSCRTLHAMKRQLDCEPSLTAKELKEKNPILADLSVRTIQRSIHEDLKYNSRKARPKPMITKKQKENRVKFCKKYSDWDINKWRKVLWSDEAIFYVSGNKPGRVYRPAGSDPYLPKYTHGTTKYPDSLMVWASFAYGGTGPFVILPKNIRLNGQNYLELLMDHLPDAFEEANASFFMQDGAPCHTCAAVVGWLRDCQVDFYDDWPGNSPDLNPIENLWALMKRKLRKCDTSTIPKLEAALLRIWRDFDPSLLKNLADSAPERLKKCLKRRGMPTKY